MLFARIWYIYTDWDLSRSLKDAFTTTDSSTYLTSDPRSRAGELACISFWVGLLWVVLGKYRFIVLPDCFELLSKLFECADSDVYQAWNVLVHPVVGVLNVTGLASAWLAGCGVSVEIPQPASHEEGWRSGTAPQILRRRAPGQSNAERLPPSPPLGSSCWQNTWCRSPLGERRAGNFVDWGKDMPCNVRRFPHCDNDWLTHCG